MTNFLGLGKINLYTKRYGFFNGLRTFLAQRCRKALDPHNISSYSQTGEDRIVGHLLNVDRGFYVDVGCNHPQRYSNTYEFYRKGWHGITIDANSNLIEEHRRVRREDAGVCAVVSDKERDIVFTEFHDSLVSSVSDSHVDLWKTLREIKEQRTVRAETLNAILERHEAPHQFDLLSIDVEDHDFEVLRSLDLQRYRPQMIVIEIHDFDIEHPDQNNIYLHLRNHDYKMIGFVCGSGYFADRRRK